MMQLRTILIIQQYSSERTLYLMEIFYWYFIGRMVTLRKLSLRCQAFGRMPRCRKGRTNHGMVRPERCPRCSECSPREMVTSNHELMGHPRLLLPRI